jgi:hypothetical protein
MPGTADEVEKKVEVDATRQGEKVVFDSEGWKGRSRVTRWLVQTKTASTTP